ncbi:hypothetical protein [Enterococcus faecalis]|uniref:hypothetical protein n=1 Tax=Enterococcus faecalis TaxID=1351 RepID=UPI001F57B8AD|nr:hypothetical protein [Enterococcus faecalis]HBI2077583.1 hypothetical protein [Enterococcus faecalis]
MLSEELELKRQKYRRFLNGKFSAYRCWCSFPYYYQLYLDLYEETSEYLVQFLLLDNVFFENEEAVVKLFEGFLEQLVRSYACKIHEDFERKIYIGSDNIEEAIGRLDIMMAMPSERNREDIQQVRLLLEMVGTI